MSLALPLIDDALFDGPFHYAGTGLALLHPDGHWLRVNRPLCTRLGYTERELRGASLADVIFDADRDALLVALEGAAAGRGSHLTCRAVHRSGHPVPLRLYVATVRNAAGRPRILLVDRQGDAGEPLAQRTALFDLSGELMCLVGRDGVVLYANRAWHALGVDPEDAMGRHYIELVHPDDRRRTLACAEGTWRGETVTGFLNRGLCQDGSYRWLEWHVHPTPDGSAACIARDVTERIRSEQERHLREEALTMAPCGIVVMEVAGDDLAITYCNPAYARMAGYEPEELLGKNPRHVLHFDDPNQPGIQVLQEAAAAGRSAETVLHGRRKDGERFYKRVRITPVPGGDGAIRYYVSSQEDVTEQLRTKAALHDEKEWLRVTLHSIGDAVLITDTDGRITYLNPVAERITGRLNAEACGQPIGAIFHVVDERTRQPLPNPVEAVLSSGQGAELATEAVLIGRDGTEIDIEDSAAPICDRTGALIGAVLVFRDVSEARRHVREMAYHAAHDPLTGLVNRRELERRLERLLTQEASDAVSHSLFYLDLDRFKVVNDSCGHAAGDELLRQLSRLLQSRLRSRDTLARLGGDEFGVLLENCNGAAAARLAEELRARIETYDFLWDNRSFRVGASIGVVTFEPGHDTAQDLLRTVDSACYLAKDRGRNRVHVYRGNDAALAARLQEAGWVNRLQSALREERLELYWQRIAPLRDDASEDRREILVRLREPDGTLVPPGAFLPAAERYDLMPAVDRHIIRAALRHLAALPAAEREHTVYSINLSAATLDDEGLPAFLQDQIEHHALLPRHVCFEITETAAIAHFAEASCRLRALKTLGFQFALDDFGSGMSSLAYLKNLPVDFLKIDGAFVRGILDDPVDSAMVEAIAGLARVMGVRTVAEYVENDAVRERLRTLGIDYVQGFGIHRPEPLAPD